MHNRQRAIDKAQKVFRHGQSTTAPGEKEKVLAVLVRLCEQQRLVLSDLDSQLPSRWDAALLRTTIGLVQGQASTTPGTRHGQAGSDRAGPSRHRASDGRVQQVEELLFREMGAAERTRQLQGAVFSVGIMEAVRNTRGYDRLLAELQSLNASNVGIGLEEPELLEWLRTQLTAPARSVPSRPGVSTLFADLATYCRSRYFAHAEQQRVAARRQEDVRRRQAEAAQQERVRQDAERQRRDRQARLRETRPTRTAKAPEREQEHPGDYIPPPPKITRSFDSLPEARLYFKVARRRVADADLSVHAVQGRWQVTWHGHEALQSDLDRAYQQAREDLEQLAEEFRGEARRVRDEAVQAAEAVYSQACEQAFQVAVDRYDSETPV